MKHLKKIKTVANKMQLTEVMNSHKCFGVNQQAQAHVR